MAITSLHGSVGIQLTARDGRVYVRAEGETFVDDAPDAVALFAGDRLSPVSISPPGFGLGPSRWWLPMRSCFGS